MRQDVSGDILVNKEYLDLKKQDLDQILVQSKRVRDTKIKRMLGEYEVAR